MWDILCIQIECEEYFAKQCQFHIVMDLNDVMDFYLLELHNINASCLTKLLIIFYNRPLVCGHQLRYQDLGRTIFLF